jgi:putative hydrolase of the HAD superfamily
MFDPAKTKAVLWDLDDTLYSRRAAAEKVFPGMLKAHLYPNASDAALQEMVAYMMTQVKRNTMIHEDMFQALIEKYPPEKPYDRARCVDYYYKHFPEFVQPYPETFAILKKLRASGVKTGLITNIPQDRVAPQWAKIRALGLPELMDVILVSGELGIHKPDVRIYEHAAKALGVSPEECVFVGDDPDSDILGALNAGMEAVWLDVWESDDRFPDAHKVRSIGEYFDNQ